VGGYCLGPDRQSHMKRLHPKRIKGGWTLGRTSTLETTTIELTQRRLSAQTPSSQPSPSPPRLLTCPATSESILSFRFSALTKQHSLPKFARISPQPPHRPTHPQHRTRDDTRASRSRIPINTTCQPSSHQILDKHAWWKRYAPDSAARAP
jgi:hypothetical protein